MSVDLFEPASLAEAVTLLERHGSGARLLAGGTAVVPQLTHQLVVPAVLISLSQIPDLNFVRYEPDGLHLGAMTPLRLIERSSAVDEFCPALARACGAVANVRVRNQATLGGSLAAREHDSDPPTCLGALEARLKMVNSAGEHSISIEDFLARPHEGILTEIIIPSLPDSGRAAFLRETKRSAEARPSVNVAAVADFHPDGRCRTLRLAAGAAVRSPQRLPQAEAWARDIALADPLIQGIAGEYASRLEPVDEPLESAWYRRELIRVLVRRALVEVRDGRG